LDEVKTEDLVKILNDMELIASQDPAVNLGSAYSVRVYRVMDDGECDGVPETCPKQTVYIAISDIGDPPEVRKVYTLPSSYGWDFDRWTHVPSKETPDDFIEFLVTEKIPAADRTKGWWETVSKVVKVNTFSAAIETPK
jgi:hypothetical protein